MANDRLALETKLLNQRADAQFVVAIAAFQRVDFGMDQGFEFRRPGDGALDAFVHGGHFAANSLTDGHDALGSSRFRLGKPKRNFRHRPCGAAQFVRTRNHDGKGEEQHDRQYDADGNADSTRHGRKIGQRADLPDFRAIEKIGDAQATDGPEQGNERGDAHCRAAGADFKRTQNSCRRLATVVVGGSKGGRAGRLFRRQGFRLILRPCGFCRRCAVLTCTSLLVSRRCLRSGFGHFFLWLIQGSLVVQG